MRRKYHKICRSAAGNDIYKEHRNHPNSKKFYKVIVNIININTVTFKLMHIYLKMGRKYSEFCALMYTVSQKSKTPNSWP